MSEVAKRTRRNQYGVKNSCDLWRTINGEHYMQWASYPTDEQVKAYRAAGIRCRRYGAELFVRQKDKDAAEAVDFELARAALRPKGESRDQ